MIDNDIVDYENLCTFAFMEELLFLEAQFLFELSGLSKTIYVIL